MMNYMWKSMRELKRKDSAFTLIELLIVILILGILSGIAIFSYQGFATRAEAACAEANARMQRVADAANAIDPDIEVWHADGAPDCSGTGGPGDPGGSDGDWTYRTPVTINSGPVNGDHTNFPLLVSVDLGAEASNVQPDGGDIVFTLANGTRLAHEIQSVSGTTVTAWVRIPSLSGSTDTELYVYYGNSEAESQEAPESVWSNGYVGVWHLDGNASDSSSNGNHGTYVGTPTTVTGRIGSALGFANSAVRVDDDDSLDVSSLTVSAWVRRTGPIADWGNIVGRQEGAGSGDLWLLYTPSSPTNYWFTAGGSNANSTSASVLNTWQHVTATYSGGTSSLYLNGGLLLSGGGGSGSLDADSNLCFGAGANDTSRNCNSEHFNGQIDEIRVSSVARSTGWISTEYANQNNPGAFVVVGVTEPGAYNP